MQRSMHGSLGGGWGGILPFGGDAVLVWVILGGFLGGRDDGEVMRCYVLDGRVLSGMGSSLRCVPGCVML